MYILFYSAVKSMLVVTSIKQSTVFKAHLFCTPLRIMLTANWTILNSHLYSTAIFTLSLYYILCWLRIKTTVKYRRKKKQDKTAETYLEFDTAVNVFKHKIDTNTRQTGKRMGYSSAFFCVIRTGNIVCEVVFKLCIFHYTCATCHRNSVLSAIHGPPVAEIVYYPQYMRHPSSK